MILIVIYDQMWTDKKKKPRNRLCYVLLHFYDSTSIIAIARVEKYKWFIIFMDFGHWTV